MKAKLIILILSILFAIGALSVQFGAWEDNLQANIDVKMVKPLDTDDEESSGELESEEITEPGLADLNEEQVSNLGEGNQIDLNAEGQHGKPDIEAKEEKGSGIWLEGKDEEQKEQDEEQKQQGEEQKEQDIESGDPEIEPEDRDIEADKEGASGSERKQEEDSDVNKDQNVYADDQDVCVNEQDVCTDDQNICANEKGVCVEEQDENGEIVNNGNITNSTEKRENNDNENNERDTDE
ncbi:MAG TPA: hypothetical protein GX527_02915 [Clostridiaceae bacterium]|jgi:hypothetical protein|nr:hypothetical protein [Clostridiaceae bacterium]